MPNLLTAKSRNPADIRFECILSSGQTIVRYGLRAHGRCQTYSVGTSQVNLT